MKNIIIFFIITTYSYGQSSELVFSVYDYAVYKNSGKYGISKNIDTVLYEYDLITRPRLQDYLFAVKNGKWGIINLDNSIIVHFEYDMIKRAWDKNDIGEESFIVQKNDKLGTIDKKNNVLIPIEYDGISGWCEYGPNAKYVKKNQKIGIYDNKGKILIPAKYDSIHYYSNNLIKAQLNGKFGVININNEVVIPFDYNAIIIDYDYWGLDKNHSNSIITRKKEIWNIFDTSGEILEKDLSDNFVNNEYTNSELTNYDFKYTEICLIKTEINYYR